MYNVQQGLYYAEGNNKKANSDIQKLSFLLIDKL